MSDVSLQFTGDAQKVENELRKMTLRAQDLGRQITDINRRAGDAGRSMGAAFSSKTLGMLTSYATGFFSVSTAISAAARSMDNLISRQQQLAAESGKAAKEMVTLAALQEGGKMRARVTSAADLAANYGITDRAMAFDIVQGLQSARGGSFAKGMQSAQEIFSASLLGLPIGVGNELEMVGAALHAAPGDFLRKAYVAGQLSGRAPADVAKGAAGLPLWQDPTLGFAAAGVLVDPFGAEIDTYLKAAGRVTGATIPPQLMKTLKKLGVADKGQMAIIEALAGAGLDTTDELSAVGVKDIRELQGLQMLVSNVPKLKSLYAGITEQAKPGLFGQQYGAIAGELPSIELSRKRDQLRAEYANEAMLEEAAVRKENDRRKLGIALRREGLEDIGPFRMTDEEGRANWWAPMLLGATSTAERFRNAPGAAMATGMSWWTEQTRVTPGGKFGTYDPNRVRNFDTGDTVTDRVVAQLQRLEEKLDRGNAQRERQTAVIEDASSRSSSGPLLRRPSDDEGGVFGPPYQPQIW